MSRRGEEARLRKAAEAGDVEAATDLALLLEDNGDLSGAERWYRAAAIAGHIPGVLGFGVMLHENGRLEEAEKWLKMAAICEDPELAGMAAIGAAALGNNLLQRNILDEAEQWLMKGIAGGFEGAERDLEELQRIRRSGSPGGTNRSSGDEVLQTFEVSSIMFYDGIGHRLGPSLCTLTRTRFIIEDARGGISQILLRDVNGVSTPGRIVSPKQLRIHAPGVAYDIYCQSKDQKNLLEAWFSKAIRGV